jgi:chromate transporter
MMKNRQYWTEGGYPMQELWLLWRLFWVFTKVALFSWGGGPASMALMQRMSVDEGWTTPPEFADALAVGNALPGPIAPQVAAYVGYKVAGLSGAISAVIGTVGPTTILMLVMIVLYFQVKDSPTVAAMLKAVRPVVVGLLLWTTLDIARSVFWKQGMTITGLIQRWDGILIAVVAFAILTFTKVNPAIVVATAALLGWLVYRP